MFVSNINQLTEYSSLIQRDVSVDVPTITINSSSSFNLYALSHEIHHVNTKCLSLVLLKRNPTIINDNYHTQLQIIDFITPKQHGALFGELIDGQRIDLSEIILTTHVIDAQSINNLIDNIIQGTMNNKNNGMSLFDKQFGTGSRIFSSIT